MTHDEAVDLLPVYALGALEDEAPALEAHLDTCPRCTALLASYLETTVTLGAAVPAAEPPASLRTALVDARATPTPPRRLESFRRSLRRSALPAVAAALLLLSIGLGASLTAQHQQLAAAHGQLALDERGLGLLTSTETTVERLTPVTATSADTHGHWYHRPGVQTQVLVVEFMPALPRGQRYYGWLRRADGSWTAAGPFTSDSLGYGRLILLGSDGVGVQGVAVTRQAAPSAAPAGPLVLSWGKTAP